MQSHHILTNEGKLWKHALAGLALGCSIFLFATDMALAKIAGCSYAMKEGPYVSDYETWLDFHPSANKLRFTNSVTDEEPECSFALGYDADAKLEDCPDSGDRIFFLNKERERFDAVNQNRCAEYIMLRRRVRKDESSPVEEVEEIYELKR